jgi:hypothetical protein
MKGRVYENLEFCAASLLKTALEHSNFGTLRENVNGRDYVFVERSSNTFISRALSSAGQDLARASARAHRQRCASVPLPGHLATFSIIERSNLIAVLTSPFPAALRLASTTTRTATSQYYHKHYSTSTSTSYHY